MSPTVNPSQLSSSQRAGEAAPPKIATRMGRHTIRSRLMLGFVLMALLPTLAVTLGAMGVGYAYGRQQAVNQLESVAALKSLEIQSWENSIQNSLAIVMNEEFAYERASTVLNLASQDKYYSFYSGAMRTRLQQVVDRSQELREIYLINLDNRVVLSTDPSQEGKIDLSGLVEIRQVDKPQLVLVTNAGFSDVSLVFLLPVHSRDGQFLGVVAERTTLEPIIRILSEHTGLGETGKSYLVNPGGEALTVSQLGGLEKGAPSSANTTISAAPVLAAITRQVGGSGTYRDYRDVPVVGVYLWQSQLGMELLVEQDQVEVFQGVFTTLFLNGGIALLAVVIAVTVSLLVAGSISRPLVNLVRTASQIAAGDLEQTARVDRDDELGALAAAFNSMTTQLRDFISSLEKRVQERTFELQAAFKSLERRALQLETSARVSRVATSILNMDDLLRRVVDLIRDVFGYYHVIVWLVDPETQQLTARAGSHERQTAIQAIAIGAGSLNGQAAQSNTTLLVNDVFSDDRFLADANLPDTRSELVLPLRLGDRVIGTLDIHNDQPNGFTAEDALVFQGLGDQIAIAIENARLYDQSQRLAILEERNRLARELHDSVTQSLYSLRILAEGWRRQAGDAVDPQVEGYLRQIGEVTDQSLREMRLLIYELRPPALESEGLIGALHQRLESVEKRAGLDARLVADDLIALPKDVEEELYWIAQEALNNALKHASATRAMVRLSARRGELSLEVEDNGRGFSVDAAPQRGGMGITSMQERASRLNGRLEIVSGDGDGTLIRAVIPLGEAAGGKRVIEGDVAQPPQNN